MSTATETLLNGVVYILEQVPVAGKAVEILQNVVFAPDHWGEIRSNAEALVNRKISEAVYNSMQANLQGLSKNLTEYVQATKHSKDNPAYIGTKFSAAKADFNQQVPLYQISDESLLLLPLFAQMATLHLTLLRDGAIHSSEWGFTTLIQDDLKQELIETIDKYGRYVQTTYDAGLKAGLEQAKNPVERFNANYGYSREMTLNVLEYAKLWPYFNPSTQQPDSLLDFEAEIYSDTFGSTFTEFHPVAPSTEKMTLIKEWEESVGAPQWDRIDTLQVRYGQTMGPIMGGAGRIPAGLHPGIGRPNSDYWKEQTLDLTKKRIMRYGVATFEAANVPRNVSGLELTFDDGTSTAFGLMASRFRPDVKSLPVISGYYMSSVTMVGPGTPPHRPGSGIGALIDYKMARAIFFGFKREKVTTPKVGGRRVFQATGARGGWADATLTVPDGYKILGGGARVNWSNPGNMLTASFPKDARTWVAKSKDHLDSSPATIDVWAIAIFDPMDDWEVKIFNNTSSSTNHPSTTAVVPEGYALTGGGAETHWIKNGALLTESYPNPQKAGSWVASSKDHAGAGESTTITAYAIGIKLGSVGPIVKIFSKTSGVDIHPSTEVSPDPGYALVGGGAKVNYHPDKGNLLTASYPDFDQNKWKVASKDHAGISDPCTITAYAIALA